MKKGFFACLLAVMFLQLTEGGCQNAKPSADKDVAVAPSLLTLADWAGFKYLDVLKRAKTGNRKALMDFLNFYSAADGMDAINHGTACLELIPIAGDEAFADAAARCVPKLREVLLANLIQGQGRTEKEELKKPLAEWAPKTWAVVNSKAPAVTRTPPDGPGEMGQGAPHIKPSGGRTSRDSATDAATPATPKQ